ncbi:MAG: PLP-dependent aminotransferase family protein [Solirubrobacteraceae bacterium]
MSYKLDLSRLQRDSEQSITAQLVELVRSAIEDGSLPPGAKLPTTRALAEDAGVNHLTVVRAYKRLAGEGFVTASRGRGTFVRQAPPTVASSDGRWQHAVLPPADRSYIRQVVADTWRITDDDDHINLAIGWASPELLPVRELARISREVFADAGSDALAYGDPDGLWELRQQIAQRGTEAGFARDADEVVVTSGGRQAIHLVTRAIVRPGDVVVTESPTYMGSLLSLQDSGARVLGIPYGTEGLDVDALEQILARHEVKLVAVQGGSQNPTGQDMSPERAGRLLELARERSFFVMEDGVYSTIRFGSGSPRRMRLSAPDHVVYVDSLSKTIGGGLRLGWIAASGEIRRRLTELKLATDYHTPVLTQHLAARWLSSGAHERHLTHVSAIYARRAEAMLGSIEQRLGDEVLLTPPKGGHHLWITFRRPIEERVLIAESLRQGVSFTPGGATTVDGDGLTGLRLSFALLDEERIDEGVRRLAAAVRAVRRAAGAGPRVAPALS